MLRLLASLTLEPVLVTVVIGIPCRLTRYFALALKPLSIALSSRIISLKVSLALAMSF